MSESTSAPSVAIMVAAYNDWESVSSLVPMLDRALAGRFRDVSVVVVDDGSADFVDPDMFAGQAFEAVSEVRVVTLRRNLGNQRAVAVGLGYVASELRFDYLVLMDADHEDKPEYVPQLLDRVMAEGDKVVFARRTQRSEGRRFRLFYAAYRALYGTLTGIPISYGNFCAMPSILVKRIASISEIWSHFPAGVMKARVPFVSIPSERGLRQHGASKMNIVNLAIHGLSGLAVHAEVVGVRIILGLFAFALASALGIAVMIVWRVFFTVHVIGWSSQIVFALLGIFLQLSIAAALVVFLVLATRGQRTVIPAWDYAKFLLDARTVLPPVTGNKGEPFGNRFR